MKKIIVWFRKDLRLHDHPALWEAAQQGMVIPVFIWSKEEEIDLHASPTAKWWLHHSLVEIIKAFYSLNIPFIIRAGNYLDELQEVIKETGAEVVYYNERYEPSAIHNDEKTLNGLKALGIQTKTFRSHLLYHPSYILTQSGEPYKMFTPFFSSLMKESIPRPYPIPKEISGYKTPIKSLYVEQLDLLPLVRWDEKLHRYWIPGEDFAIKQWTRFLKQGVHRYPDERDVPAAQATSGLSPYLSSGNISVRAIWYAAKRHVDENKDVHGQVDAFLRQLAWREFSYYQLWHHPSITNTPLRHQFESFPWMNQSEHLDCWKRGITGYPLVDAGMRELWETGAMHNRVRMVAASFLVKHLLVNWTEGLSWFRHTLVDFDPANNSMGWQWIAGTGFDSAPYFRIFNPILQSEKFDKDGEYIRTWLPELSKLPAPYIHRPWDAPADILEEANIVLGETYPFPIVDHTSARERALRAYEEIK
ncbi:cryptochrome/photolyase family protein [Bacillus sp. AK128]